MKPAIALAGAVSGAAALGAAMALGHAPFEMPYAALPALAAAVIWVPGGRATFLKGWILGSAYFTVTLLWILEPFQVDVETHGWLAPFALGGLAGGLALFWGVAAHVGARLGGALGFAVALSTAELARAYLFTGLPWALPAYLWLDLPQAQLAAFAGPHGLTFLTVIAVALPWSQRRRGAVRLAAACLPAVLLAAAPLLRPAPASTAGDGAPLVRLVQPNIPQRLKWSRNHIARWYGILKDLSRDSGADLVIWPETAVPYDIEADADVRRDVAGAVGGPPLVTGANIRGGAGWSNGLLVIDRNADILASYRKHHLVPFGEYIPFGDLLGLDGLAENIADFDQGEGPLIIDLGPRLGKVLPTICYEAIFPQNLRADGRPDWLLQITNDAWFGTVSGPQQHLAQVRFRAIEQGLPALRAANTGISAAIDPAGRLIDRLDLGIRGVIDVRLPDPLPPTPYARTGDAPVALLLALALLGLAAARRRRPRRGSFDGPVVD